MEASRSIVPGSRGRDDSHVRMPNQMPPLPRRVARWEWIAQDLIDVVAARWLVPDDLPCALDGIGVSDPFALVADSEHEWSAWLMVPRPAA